MDRSRVCLRVIPDRKIIGEFILRSMRYQPMRRAVIVHLQYTIKKRYEVLSLIEWISPLRVVIYHIMQYLPCDSGHRAGIPYSVAYLRYFGFKSGGITGVYPGLRGIDIEVSR
ncbi:hypothetical protein DSECCO2_578360 [anaerobic digester metagenome]